MRRLSSVSSLVLLLVAVFFGGCAERDKASPPSGAAKVTLAADAPSPPVRAERSLITTWTAAMTVGDPATVASDVRAKTEELGGYVANASTSDGDEKERSAHLDLRVPSDKLGELRTALKGHGVLTTDNETSEDVTDARADLEARLAAARTEEARVLDLMKNKTGSIGDVLETEKELARIRENIERLDAERRTLAGRVDYATVRVSIAPNVPSAWSTPGESVMKSWRGGVHAAKATAVVLAMMTVAVAPFALPLVALGAFVYYAARRLRMRPTHLEATGS